MRNNDTIIRRRCSATLTVIRELHLIIIIAPRLADVAMLRRVCLID